MLRELVMPGFADAGDAVRNFDELFEGLLSFAELC
jgi:hypothetical protein